ncbi:MAG: hypothetical protein PHQ98_00575 [Candidatus ainarchaeum sp.]|nr:hypothetical protein [Candidatus ainarchaeum sp.]
MVQTNLLPKIELIPLVHDNQLKCHEAIINYIQKLPRNSRIALEVPFNYNEIFQQINNYKIAIKRFGSPEDKEKVNELFSDYNAFEEIIITAKKRGIEIIPIESKSIKQQHNKITDLLKKKFSKTNSKKLEILENLREHAMSANIRASAYTRANSLIFVIVGAGHIANLREQLSQFKDLTNISINTIIFGRERKLIREIINDNAKKSKTKQRVLNSLKIALLKKRKKAPINQSLAELHSRQSSKSVFRHFKTKR